MQAIVKHPELSPDAIERIEVARDEITALLGQVGTICEQQEIAQAQKIQALMLIQQARGKITADVKHAIKEAGHDPDTGTWSLDATTLTITRA